MSAHYFNKKSVGLNPFVSIRDCAIFAATFFIFAVLLTAIVLWTAAPKGLFQAAFIGALIGFLPSLVLVLPVRGIVPRGEKGRFLAEIAKRRFVAEREKGDVVIYVFPAPWWAKWDSKRVVIQDLEDGDLLATVPLYLFRGFHPAPK